MRDEMNTSAIFFRYKLNENSSYTQNHTAPDVLEWSAKVKLLQNVSSFH